MTYRLSLLGPFELVAPGGERIDLRSKKGQVLVAMLALAGGEPVRRSELTGVLWGDRDDDHARNSLRQALTALRKLFSGYGRFPFVVTEEGAAIDREAIGSDLDALNAANGEAFRPAEFLEGLSLPDAPVQDWLLIERRRLAALMTERLAAQLGALEPAGRLDEAALVAHDILALDPLNEPACRALMRCSVALGERARAIRYFETLRERLRAEFGIEPDAESRALVEEIRREGAAVASARPADDTGLPGIAVMPFDSLSDDRALRYLCDGLTESITTDLSRFQDIQVISSVSSFTYKGTAVPVQQVARELGVHYLLQGAVQGAEGRVRITVRLVDGETGRQVWTERFDKAVDDLFAVQDEVTETVAATLASGYGGRLRKAWQKRRATARPRDMRAFDFFTRGIDKVDLFTAEGNAQGRELLKRAVELDPDYSKAYGKLAWTYILDAIEGWTDDYEGAMAEGRRCALEGMRRDDNENWALWALAGTRIYEGEHDLAISELERAHAMNPNDADVMADLGFYLSYSGQAERGYEVMRTAMRLNPYHPNWYVMQFVTVCFDARRYAEAVETLNRLNGMETVVCCISGAAAHAALGNRAGARAVVARILQLEPEATVTRWTSPRLAPYAREEDRAHLTTHLRNAGLPD